MAEADFIKVKVARIIYMKITLKMERVGLPWWRSG